MARTTSSLDSFAPIFQQAGQAWNVDPDLLHAVAGAESSGNPGAVSPKGAIGLMQIMPSTAKGLGINPNDPQQSIFAAAKLLSDGIDQYGSPEAALKAYNGGGQANWNNPETSAYPSRVASFYQPGTVAAAVARSQGGAPAAPYQVASADTGSMSDAAPNPNAPPATSAAAPSGRPDDQTMMSMLTGGAPPAAGTGNNGAPASSSGIASAARRPSDSDMMTMLTSGGSSSSGSSSAPANTEAAPSQPGWLSNLGSGANAAASAVGGAINRGVSAADQAVPLFGTIDNAIGLSPGHLAAVQQADQADEAAYQAGAGKTLAGKVGKVGGEIALTVPMIETGAGALGLGGNALAGAVGGTGGRLLQAGSNMLTGAGGDGMAARVLTGATSGVAKGAAGGALTSSPGQTGNDAGYGAEWGAALGGTGALVAPLVAPILKGTALLSGHMGSGLLDMLAPAVRKAAAAAPGDAADGTRVAASGTSEAVSGAPSPVPNPLQPEAPPAAGGLFANALDGSSTSDAGAAPPSGQNIPTSIAPQGLTLTQRGADAVADRIVRQFAEGGPVSLSPSASLPGGAFDASEATGNAGIGALKNFLVNNNPSAGNLFAGIKDTNNAARLQVLSGILGTPSDLEGMEAAREAATAQAHKAAFSSTQPVDVQPVHDALQEAIDAKQGYPAVQKPLETVQKTLQDITQTDPETGAVTADPEHLWNLRQQINAMISPKAAGTASDGRQAAAQLLALKPTLDSSIETGAPGFGNFIQQYSDLSRPIDGMRWLQNQGIGITDSQGNITLAKIDSTLKTLQRQQGANGVNAAMSVTPEQQQALVALRENLRTAGAAAYRGKVAGSNSVQNLGSNALVNAMMAGDGIGSHMVTTFLPTAGAVTEGPVGALIGGGLAATRYGANALAQRGSGMVMNALTQRMTNPEAFGRAVNPLAPGR